MERCGRPPGRPRPGSPSPPGFDEPIKVLTSSDAAARHREQGGPQHLPDCRAIIEATGARAIPTLTRRLINLCARNPDGSYATRANRRLTLIAAGWTLRELGYNLMDPQGLKPKHVEALVAHWRSQGRSTGTLKNKLAVLRWWAEKVDKASVIARRQCALRDRAHDICRHREQGLKRNRGPAGANLRPPSPRLARAATGLRSSLRRGHQVPAELR